MGKKEVALEISSSGVKLLAGYVFENEVYILHALEAIIPPIYNGDIIDRDSVVNAIKEVINVAAKSLDFKVEEVILALPAIDLKIINEKTTTSTVSSDNYLTDIDVSNAMSAIKKQAKNKVETSYEIVNVVPLSYLLDNGQIYAKLDDNIITREFTLNADVCLLKTSLIEQYVSCVREAGLEIKQKVVSSCGAVTFLNRYVETPQKYFYIDYGYNLTTVSKASRNSLIDTLIIGRGSKNIDSAIMRDFSCTEKKAIELKELYGLEASPKFEYYIYEKFTINDLNKSIKSELDKLFAELKDVIRRLGEENLTILLSGGGSNLFGLKELFANTLGLRVLEFTPGNYGARNKSYVTSISMIYYDDKYPLSTSINRFQDMAFKRVDSRTTTSFNVKNKNEDEKL